MSEKAHTHAPENAQSETVRAALVRVGDVAPAGTVEGIEFYGDLRRIDITVGGVTHSRDFDALVDRQVRR